MQRLRFLTTAFLLAIALAVPASSANAEVAFGEITACVDAERFAFSVEFNETVPTEVNFQFVGEGTAFQAPIERFTVNFDVPTLELSRDGEFPPRVLTSGDPAFDRFEDGPVSDFTLTDLGGDNYRVEASFPNGVDAYEPGDVVQGAVTRTFSPTSDSTFSSDVTLDECVTPDTTAPALTDMPADTTVEATSPDGATVDYTAPAATDDVDPEPTVTCDPPSGSVFALGTTTVTCTAQDSSGNTSSDTFDATVLDTTGPALDGLPDDTTAEATSSEGATVEFSLPTASDTVDVDPSVLCDPPSGSTFPLGTTTVTCTATDTTGNSTTGSFDVTVVDTTPPPLVLSAALTELEPVTATGDDGAAVDYPTPTSDDSDATVVCDPPSGSTFPVGTTTVTCTATDSAGNSTSDSFEVEVLAAEIVRVGADALPIGAAALLLLVAGGGLVTAVRARP